MTEERKVTSVEDLLASPFTGSESSLEPEKEHTVPEVMQQLDPERQEQAKQLAQQINEKDLQSVITYGAAAQKELGNFSHKMLAHVQNKDTGEIGDALTHLMGYLNETNPSDLSPQDTNFFKKLFGKVKRTIFELQAKYQAVGVQVDRIAIQLDREKDGLLKDNEQLETLYEENKNFFEALNIYIAAGEMKIKEMLEEQIPTALAKAEQSGSQMDVQEVNDLRQFVDRLEKRTHDLKLTRQMTIQQAPQIRLIQNTNQALAEKIQSSISTAIPLWKNQIAIALTILRQKEAVTTQRQVSETTNDLLKKNSEMLKTSAIETAKENERGIIDIETLQKTQQDLIETIEETLHIQSEGRLKRQKAEQDLQQMEQHLQQNLLRLTKEDQARK